MIRKIDFQRHNRWHIINNQCGKQQEKGKVYFGLLCIYSIVSVSSFLRKRYRPKSRSRKKTKKNAKQNKPLSGRVYFLQRRSTNEYTHLSIPTGSVIKIKLYNNYCTSLFCSTVFFLPFLYQRRRLPLTSWAHTRMYVYT